MVVEKICDLPQLLMAPLINVVFFEKTRSGPSNPLEELRILGFWPKARV